MATSVGTSSLMLAFKSGKGFHVTPETKLMGQVDYTKVVLGCLIGYFLFRQASFSRAMFIRLFYIVQSLPVLTNYTWIVCLPFPSQTYSLGINTINLVQPTSRRSCLFSIPSITTLNFILQGPLTAIAILMLIMTYWEKERSIVAFKSAYGCHAVAALSSQSLSMSISFSICSIYSLSSVDSGSNRGVLIAASLRGEESVATELESTSCAQNRSRSRGVGFMLIQIYLLIHQIKLKVDILLDFNFSYYIQI